MLDYQQQVESLSSNKELEKNKAKDEKEPHRNITLTKFQTEIVEQVKDC